MENYDAKWKNHEMKKLKKMESRKNGKKWKKL